MSADPQDGWWCRACRTRHGAMSCGLQTERVSLVGHEGFRLLWLCPKTGNVIHTMEPPEREDDAGSNGRDDAEDVQ
jgi:hypothetical protein